MTFPFRYIIRIQYLGFRYSGWQVQPGAKTVEGMIRKTLEFILPGKEFKTLAAGRTDAKVSAIDQVFELFLQENIENTENFIMHFNENLPPDIRAMKIQSVDDGFNVIKDSREKEYHYHFSNEPKAHPFSAPFLANIADSMDVELMREAASIFIGEHDFRKFTVKDAPENTTRTVTHCEIVDNDHFQASFFPDRTYLLKVRGRGFLRYQVRMMAGALIELGKGTITLNDLRNFLQEENGQRLTNIAPGSGLLLYDTEFGYL